MRRALPLLAPVLVASAAAAGEEARAQDLEAVSGMRGVQLPQAYYDQIQADSTAYHFKRALFRRAAPAKAAARGTVRLPVVLALFRDSPDPPHITRAMVQAALFDGPSPRGTLTNAYLDMSRGALEVRGDVFPWVRTSLALSEVVGASDGLGNDGAVGAYFREALDALDPALDFATYDSDGPDGIANSGDDDGFVDVVTFEHLEVGAHCGGPAVWAHRWTLSARLGGPYVTDDVGFHGDPIRIDDYITQGASDCTGARVQDASVMAHEFGHALGLPDYYHWLDRSAGPFGRRWVLGCWSLMAAGSWGCGAVVHPPGDFGPTHLTALSKHQLGWLDYVEPGEVWNHEVVLDPVQASGVALRIPLDEGGHEFLVAEYRARTGFDRELPSDGVVIYKHDLRASLRPAPVSGAPYRLTLIEQDADSGLLRTHAEGGDRGEAEDAWGVDGAIGELHAETRPALRLSDGTATSVAVHAVTVRDGRAHLLVSTSATPRLVVPTGPFDMTRVAEFVAALRIAGGTMPYTARGSVPSGLSVVPRGDGFTVDGAPVDATDLFLWVEDAAGEASDPVALSASEIGPWAAPVTDLLGPFLDPEAAALTPTERGYLDTVGNANGTYDVGDLRRWLRRATAR